ncbi:MAG: 50S ribosomal protein L18 [Candidatus Eisenbacteria bacterium]|nr:50S ribosomal protein L18 [Candidatus Latescibacterota bacterium]MBD3301969.1 50S ribosomal protein L18 [Candidatus Eisenbacteria bacterium]
MRSIAKERAGARRKRHRRIRKRVKGSAQVPRLCVFRSTKHIYVQVVDDDIVDGNGEIRSGGVCICGASSLSKEIAGELNGLSKVERSKKVGTLIAKLAKEKGIERVAFDRGGYLYHGRVRALAEGAREGGLKF